MRRPRPVTSGKKSKALLCLALSLVILMSLIPGRVLAVSDEAETQIEAALEVVQDEIEQEESPEPPEPEPAESENPEQEEVKPTPEPETELSLVPDGEEADGIEGEEEEEEEVIYENSISGVLWLDIFEDTDEGASYGDGIRQPEEEPIAGYPVRLYAADDTENVVQAAITYSDGSYEFTNLEPGEYVVGISSGSISGTEYLLPLVGISGDNKFIMADDYINAYSDVIVIDEDSAVTDIDAGMRTPPGISPMGNVTTTFTAYFQIFDEYGVPKENVAWEVWSYTQSGSATTYYTLLASGKSGEDGLISVGPVSSTNYASSSQWAGIRMFTAVLDGTTSLYRNGLSILDNTYDDFEDTRTLSNCIPKGGTMYYIGGMGSQNSSLSAATSAAYWGNAAKPFAVQMLREVIVTFNPQGGAVSRTTGTYWSNDVFNTPKGTEFTAVPTPTRTGCTFDGWYDALADGNKVSGDNIVGYVFPPPASTGTATTGTLYAYWAADITEKYVDEAGASLGKADKTSTVLITSQPGTYNLDTLSDKIIVDKNIYEYVGYQVSSSFVPGSVQQGAPPPLTVTKSETVYLVYRKLDTTFDIVYPTDWEFYVDGESWPNIETGSIGTHGAYYTFDNSRSGCAVLVEFTGMRVENDDGLTFVNTEASESPPGSGHISIDLKSAELDTLINGFSFEVLCIDESITYEVFMGTLYGTAIRPAGTVSDRGYVVIGGSCSDYLTGSGKYPQMAFSFEFTLIVRQEETDVSRPFEESG